MYTNNNGVFPQNNIWDAPPFQPYPQYTPPNININHELKNLGNQIQKLTSTIELMDKSYKLAELENKIHMMKIDNLLNKIINNKNDNNNKFNCVEDVYNMNDNKKKCWNNNRKHRRNKIMNNTEYVNKSDNIPEYKDHIENKYKNSTTDDHTGIEHREDSVTFEPFNLGKNLQKKKKVKI